MKKFNPLILKKMSGKNSIKLIVDVGINVKIRIKKANIENIIKILLSPAKNMSVEIIPNNAFLEFV